MNAEPILFPRRCERCHGRLAVRRASFFTDETICEKCHAKEAAALAALRLAGQPWVLSPKKDRRAAAR